jgi:SnoaL-like domain
MPESARDQLIKTLRNVATVNEPTLGEVSPAEVESRGRLWPGEKWADVELVAVTQASERRLEEYRLTPADGSEVLPLAVMIDGDKARMYCAHGLVPDRAPMLSIDPAVETSPGPGDFLDGYFSHLEDANLEASLAMFEPDGYIQHSNGHRFQGPDRLRADYVTMFKANGGRIGVKFANVMDDGERRAFECVMPSGRPAVAVYERGASGKIAAIRISL